MKNTNPLFLIMKKTYVLLLVSFLLLGTNNSWGQCNTNTSVCVSGTAGPFTFVPKGTAVGTCLNWIGPNAAYVILYVTTSGPLNLLINGNVNTGFLDVAVFNIPKNSDPCTAIKNSSNQILCNYASNASGCNQFGNAFSCNSTLPSINVTAGQTIMIVVENWSGASSNFTLSLGPAPGAQAGMPSAAITPVTTSLCPSSSPVQLTAASMGGTWSGPGVSATGLFTPATAGVGMHTIKYVVGGGSCKDSATTTISVGDVSITPPANKSICLGDSVALTASGTGVSGPVSYTWSPALGLSATAGATVVASPDTTITYTVTAVSLGCSKSATVTVSIKPDPAIIIGGPTSFCAGDSVKLTSTFLSGNLWSTGETTQSIIVKTSGSYVLAVPTQTCPGDTVAITVKPFPNAVASAGGPIPFCAGEAVVLHVQSISGATYQWRKNGLDILGGVNISRLVNTPGSYTVKVTLNGCPKESLPIAVNILPLPEPVVTAVGPILSTDPIYTSYNWLRYNQTIINANDYTYTALQNGDYTVLVSDIYGCLAVSDPYAISGLPPLNAGTILVDAVKVYPNPTQGIVQITAPVKVNVVLVSADGKEVLHQNNASLIDMTPLAAGIYMLRIMDAKGNLIKVERLVKNAR
jgi:hypothetical protein